MRVCDVQIKAVQIFKHFLPAFFSAPAHHQHQLTKEKLEMWCEKSCGLPYRHCPRTLILLHHTSLGYTVHTGCRPGAQKHKSRCAGLLAPTENNEDTVVYSSDKLCSTKPRAATSGPFVLISFFNTLCLRICCCLWLERHYCSGLFSLSQNHKTKDIAWLGVWWWRTLSLPMFWVPLSLKDKMCFVEDLISS